MINDDLHKSNKLSSSLDSRNKTNDLIANLSTVIDKYYRQNENGFNNLNQLARVLNTMAKGGVSPIPISEISSLRQSIVNADGINKNLQELRIIRKELTTIWQLLR